MANSFLKNLFRPDKKRERRNRTSDFDKQISSDISSRDYIYNLIQAYDEIRNSLMASFFQGGDKQILQIVAILHEFACPVFFAWEYYGYGKMGDFWKEDLAINAFKKFKSLNVLEKVKKDYGTMSVFFPLRALDEDGNLQKCTLALLKVLIEDLENE